MCQLKKLWKSGSLAENVGPLADDQRERREHHADAEGDEVRGVDPAEVRVHPRQQLLGVDDRDLDVEDVGEELPDLLPLVLACGGGSGPWPGRGCRSGRCPASWSCATNRVRSSIEIVCGRYFRSKAFLTSWRVCLPSNCWRRKYSSILNRKYFRRDRVLDDVVRHPLVELGLDDQVGPELDLEVLGGLPQRAATGPGWERNSSVGGPRLGVDRWIGEWSRSARSARRSGPDRRSRPRPIVRSAAQSARRASAGGRRSAAGRGGGRGRVGVEVDGHLGLQAGLSSWSGFSNSA